MVVYYSSEDMTAIKNLHLIKASITTARITRYLIAQSKILARSNRVINDSVTLKLEFYFPTKHTEFIIGGLAYHSKKIPGPIWFERRVINHEEVSVYETNINDPTILGLLKDKTNVGFFAFPYNASSNEELMFAMELSKTIL